jgi:type II secretory pathway component PulF
LPHLIYVYIRLGESSGDLAQACGLCVSWLQRQQTWKRMLWQISFYPLLLILTSIALLIVMLGYVLPEFASLYRVLNVTLPPSTAWLLRFAEQAPGLVRNILIIVAGSFLGLALAWRTPAGRFQCETFLLRLPGIKRLISHHYEFQLALQLGTLLQGACPLLEALDFIRLGAQSPLYKDYLKNTQQKIREGQSLRQSFCHGLICSPTFTALISHAQQTGHLESVLLNLASQHGDLFVHWQERAKHLIQPCITLIMGGFLGFWILLLYYPMLQLGTNLG